MATSNSRIKEGDRLIAEAEESLKTSFWKLKLSPDYDNAANSYNKAGLAYRNGKAYQKAKEAYFKAAENYTKKNADYHSAKALEDAGSVCKEMNNLEETADLWVKASDRFIVSDAQATGIIVLENAAKLLERSNPSRSAKLCLKLAGWHKTDDAKGDWGKALRKAGNMFIAAKKFDEALSAYSEYRVVLQSRSSSSDLPIHVAIMVQVLILLRLGKAKDAKSTLKSAYSVLSFEGTKEAALLEALMEALTTQDTPEFAKLCSDHLIKTLDTPVVKMARDLPDSVTGTTNLLEGDDEVEEEQQLLDDGDDDNKIIDLEGATRVPMKTKPRTKADNLRDELFGISRAPPPKKEAVSSLPPPSSRYQPTEDKPNVPADSATDQLSQPAATDESHHPDHSAGTIGGDLPTTSQLPSDEAVSSGEEDNKLPLPLDNSEGDSPSLQLTVKDEDNDEEGGLDIN